MIFPYKIASKIFKYIVEYTNSNDLFLLKDILFSKLGYGLGGNPENSGEKKAIQYIKLKLNISRKPIVFDVGANIGNYTKLIKTEFKSAVEIYAFEPSKMVFKELESAIQFDNCHLFNFGFSNAVIEATLNCSPDNSLISSVYDRNLDHHNIELSYKETIKLETIDDFCGNSNIQHIDFLKIDVEGHEIEVLKGASKMIAANKINFIQFEFGGCNIDSRTFIRDFWTLLSEKYQLYLIHPNGVKLIEKYSEGLEIFQTSNYLAELKR